MQNYLQNYNSDKAKSQIDSEFWHFNELYSDLQRI